MTKAKIRKFVGKLDHAEKHAAQIESQVDDLKQSVLNLRMEIHEIRSDLMNEIEDSRSRPKPKV
ncbi:MAG: hypothetical protein OXE50_15310, partial [Chloroflexi bacterium]|nr:hypothetical protein [Chloroflexota bacterium]